MPGLPILRQQIAAKMKNLYNLNLDPETEITITAGGTQAIFCIIAAFVGYQDEVILLEPCYDSYRPSVETVGGVAVPYTLHAPDYKIDWDAVKQLISPKTKLICVNTPGNPTGQVFTKSDWDALARILENTNVLLLSDEVYEHLVYDNMPHLPALGHPKLKNRTLAVYSFGKTYHNTGWKTGYCIAPQNLTAEFRKIHQFNVFSANTPMQAAFAEFMENPEPYQTLPSFYQEKRDLFATAMQKTRFKPLPCKGTYFQLYDYSAISELPDREFCEWLTIEHGVAAIPVSPFYSNGHDDHVIRFCFSKTSELLLQAAEKLQCVP